MNDDLRGDANGDANGDNGDANVDGVAFTVSLVTTCNGGSTSGTHRSTGAEGTISVEGVVRLRERTLWCPTAANAPFVYRGALRRRALGPGPHVGPTKKDLMHILPTRYCVSCLGCLTPAQKNGRGERRVGARELEDGPATGDAFLRGRMRATNDSTRGRRAHRHPSWRKRRQRTA